MCSEFGRRSFLQLLGVGAGATLLPACTDAPVQHLYAYLTPPGEIVPGQATWYASVCRECPVGCGLHVRTREARPVKLEGNPVSPINRGALCLRGQAALQGLFDPDRIILPRLGKLGHTQPAGAEKTLKYYVDRLSAAGWKADGSGKPIGLLTDFASGATSAVCEAYSKRMGGTWVAWEPVQFAGLKQAANHLFGLSEVPRFDLSAVDFVLNLGADLFEGWMSPVEHARQLADVRFFDASKPDVPVVFAGPRRDLTCANADTWLSIRPGTQAEVALGLASELLASSGLDPDSRAKLATWLKPYSLTRASQKAGCDLSQLSGLAKRLKQARKAIALPPGEHLLGADATFAQAAVLVLDLVLGAVDRSVLFGQSLPWDQLQPAARVEAMLERAAKGELAAVIIAGANPVYSWPDASAVRKALAKVPLVVQITEALNETSKLAQVILPASNALESWGDHVGRSDWLGLQQPVIQPAGQSRQMEDWLIALAAQAGVALPWSDLRQCLAQRWAGLQQAIEPSGDPTRFFETALAAGGLVVPPAALPKPAPEPDTWAGRTLLSAEGLPPAGESSQTASGPVLLIYPSGRLYDGRCANRPWIQEFPDSLTQTPWDTPLELSAKRAAEFGLKSGDRVLMKSAMEQIEATARVMPGMRDDLVAMPLGGGRQHSGRFADQRGARAVGLLGLTFDPVGGGLAWLQGGIELKKAAAGDLLTVEGDPTTHGRPIVPTVRLADARAGVFPKQTLHGIVMVDIKTGEVVGPADAHHVPAKPEKPKKRQPGQRPKDSFYPAHDFPEHMWGMTVDLDRCTGCGACVLACQAENNVATVGPEEIHMGREMQWIRIERYWVEPEPGSAEPGPVPRFIPVMCQHCEKAPCEPVCPVFASYHTRDGLNAQIYNRCVGTRYCANNCPYKVRRFNWFDYKWPVPLNHQLNPDVVVRSAGVMEKCTLCVQRIREKYNLAKAEGRKLAEGEIVPACAQTCPSKAIIFGDRKREASRVSQSANDPRAYKLLDYYLDTKPAVSYLCKVDRSEPARKK